MHTLRYILRLFALLSFIYPEIAIAQPRETQETSLKGAVFSGMIDGGRPGRDSLRIFFVDNLATVYGNGMVSPTRKVFFAHTDKDGRFSFRLPLVTKNVGAIHFQLFGDEEVLGSKIVPLTDPIYPYYYVENSDSIHININIAEGKITTGLSGIGLGKYHLVNNLVKVKKLNLFEEIDYESEKNFEDNLNTVISSNQVFKALVTNLLDYYKHDVSSNVHQLIKADFFYYIDKYSLTQFERFYFANDTARVRKEYIKYCNSVEPLAEELALLSHEYITYIFEKSILNLKIKYNQDNSRKELYKALKKNYDGVLRDKLITYYLCSRWGRHGGEVDKGEYNHVLNDAYDLIQHQELKDIIASKIQKYSKGSLAYNFALPDINGNVIKLQDFQGKVVLLHIYSTRCTGCRIFARTLKNEVFPKFKDNPDVVFIAISIEKNRDRWLQDLEKGHNASKEHEVNLYTNGEGNNHPYIKYYDINLVPTIFLIDRDSKIYNSSANTLKSGTTGKEIITMIYDALDANK